MRLLFTLKNAKAFHLDLYESVGKDLRMLVLRFDIENSDNRPGTRNPDD